MSSDILFDGMEEPGELCLDCIHFDLSDECPETGKKYNEITSTCGSYSISDQTRKGLQLEIDEDNDVNVDIDPDDF